MHGENKICMKRKWDFWEEIRSKTQSSQHEESVAHWRKTNEGGELRNYSFSGGALLAGAWILARGPKRKTPRARNS